MAYHLYTTPGIVLSSNNYGEADKVFSIFTLDLGLISASAKSVRLEASKLRGDLEESSLGEFSFVKGIDRWRITNARAEKQVYRNLNKDERFLVARTFNFLKKLVAGEEKHEALFLELKEALYFLDKQSLTKEELVAFEYVFILRLLKGLGYYAPQPKFESFVETSAWSTFLLRDALSYRKELLSQINESIEASQL